MIAAIVVLFPALVNIVLGLRGASPQALDVIRVNGGSSVTELTKVRIPSALPQFFASVRISVPGAIVGAMLAEWLVGFDGMGGVLSGYKGSGQLRRGLDDRGARRDEFHRAVRGRHHRRGRGADEVGTRTPASSEGPPSAGHYRTFSGR